MKISDLDFWGGALHLRLEQLLITRNEFLSANGAYLDKSPSLFAELQSIEQQIADVEGKIESIDRQLALHERAEPQDAHTPEKESWPPNKRATAKRVRDKEVRQRLVRNRLSKIHSTGTAKEKATEIQKLIKCNLERLGFARAPAISTIQNDITAARKDLGKRSEIPIQNP